MRMQSSGQGWIERVSGQSIQAAVRVQVGDHSNRAITVVVWFENGKICRQRPGGGASGGGAEAPRNINVTPHEGDGAGQFLGDSMTVSGGVLSCLHHPIEKDHSLIELADLALGWYAERARPSEPWIRRRHPGEGPE
jgi:hypothetical protein